MTIHNGCATATDQHAAAAAAARGVARNGSWGFCALLLLPELLLQLRCEEQGGGEWRARGCITLGPELQGKHNGWCQEM